MGDDGQLDLFSISAIDPPWRDNRDAMEFPFLSLQKRRTTPIEFERNGMHVSVAADPRFSIATIWDWDVMIFAAGHLNDAIEGRRKVSPRISFVPHDCLKQIGRPIGGEHYRRLADAIRRLAATLVITNIREVDQPDRGGEAGFHWLTGYWIPKRYRRYRTAPSGVTYITPRDPEGEADPARPWEIELHPWLYNAIVRQGDILAVHPDYFQLSGGLERWLYRLARKAVPDKAAAPAIRFKMETLHEQSGVTRDLRLFAFDVRKIAETQPLPEYAIQIEYRKGRRELVTLYRDKAKPGRPPRGRRLATVQGNEIAPFADPKWQVSDIDEEPVPLPDLPIPSVTGHDEQKTITPIPLLPDITLDYERLLERYLRHLKATGAAAGKSPPIKLLILPLPDSSEELRRLLNDGKAPGHED